MNRVFHRRSLLRTGLAFGASLALPAARACEYFSVNLRVTHPWTRASGADARYAIVCMKFDAVAQADRLIGVQTPVAEGAEMGGAQAGKAVNFLIPAGEETALAEEGTHLRLVGLRFPLEVARSYPLQLIFERGGALDATLNVDYLRFN